MTFKGPSPPALPCTVGKRDDQLPQGWAWMILGDMIENVPLTGKKLKQSAYLERGKFPVIDQGQPFIAGFTDEQQLVIPRKSPVIVFGDHTKAIKYVSFDFVAGADGIKVIAPTSAFFPKLFYYFLQTIELPDKGYARHFQFLVKSPLPLPPLPEQHRIVAKIEELFTKLDAGVEALKKVKAQIKRYRQAVLKAAFEGKLTEKWRTAELANPDSPLRKEPASVLLERIRKEREKTGKPNHRHAPALPDTSTLPDLPDGWVWTTLDCLSWDAGYGTSVKCDYKFDGPPVLRIPNVVAGKIDLTDLKYASSSKSLDNAGALSSGDLLVVRTNGSKDLIGRAATVSQHFERPHFFASYLIRFRLVNVGCLPAWVGQVFDTDRVRRWLEREAATTAGQYNISMTKLVRLPIEVAPLAEQQKIVAEIARRFSAADEVEKTVDRGLKQAERLRQSILKRAFEGKLVPQDPNDEPAEKLLERIRAERTRTDAPARKPRRKTRNDARNEPPRDETDST